MKNKEENNKTHLKDLDAIEEWFAVPASNEGLPEFQIESCKAPSKYEDPTSESRKPVLLDDLSERSIATDLTHSIESGDVNGIGYILTVLKDRGKDSQDRILSFLKQNLERDQLDGFFRNVSWETGANNNGCSVLRLHIRRNGQLPLAYHGVMLGSDGLNSGFYNSIERNESLDPQKALRRINLGFRLQQGDFYKLPQEKTSFVWDLEA